jgi:hypothetical protein
LKIENRNIAKLVIAISLLFSLGTLTMKSQNAPVITAATLSTADTAIMVSLTGANFINIASCNLELNYDPEIALVTSVTSSPLLGGNLDVNLNVPGRIFLGWYIYPAKTLDGNPVLFNIAFKKVKAGTSPITFPDTANSCVWYDGNYNTLTDTPASAYYMNGALTFVPGLGISPGNEDANGLTLTCAPNPFTANTKLSWFLPASGDVTLEIFSMTGERVGGIITEKEQPGDHCLNLGSAGLAKGTYLARIILKKKNEIMTKSIKIISN